MISKEEISGTIKRYRSGKITIGTICSHSALQIFYGARQEGFKTIGICTPDRRFVYEAFRYARPDYYIILDDYKDLVEERFQEELLRRNAVVIPHGSFVEYVGAENLKKDFHVPIYGNRSALEFEGDRRKMRTWLQEAGVRVPREYQDPSEIDRLCIVKFHGARGGRGFFVVDSEKKYREKVEIGVKKGIVNESDLEKRTIQELVVGVRYYPQYFYSLMFQGEVKAGEGRVELLGVDRRVESNVDDLYRIPKPEDSPGIEPSYVITGNIPAVLRESLLPRVLDLGRRVTEASVKLFPPGIIGPFCMETICTDSLEFVTFEVSARIVAGTNLYPGGSPYSCYLFSEPMSTGRRIALEIKEGIRKKRLIDLVS
ncbi:formate--phosphoribosylaminoimidazolecarboxamide ligase [Candidatus Bathyarchaeota archaeon]|nr:formate--phosphoribosylaminoimidazolecarboxamide ligase [Candidatus Bathyarchaeota archaeon]